ncbi:MAG: methylmalonyl-CoA carboxyltransferase [Chloroflexi bacterium]|nr:methylmalonyl-CoA carboxyltransferase [Chloroflexota bacterium]
MDELKEKQLNDLKARRARIEAMGGKERVEAQKKRGKLTARERVDLLLDKGSFHEIGAFAKSRSTAYEDVPADGVVTGYGKIDGRKVFIFSQDFTSMGGTVSEIHSKKIVNVLENAMKAGCPVIGLNDSGGARIQDGVEGLVGYGEIFRRNTWASGVIPQICAILGPCAGGAVYSPALMDFIFMVKGLSHAFITGPRVVKAVLGQDISEEELGGATVVQAKAGVSCRTEESEVECLQSIRELLGFLPLNNREAPPRVDWGDSPTRTDPALFDLVPSDSHKPYDVRKLIERIFDQRPDGKKNYYELFPKWASNIVTCFTRLNGQTVGVLANQPMSKAGCIDINSADKASRFIRFCDAFSIPIINVNDVPGYLPGTDQEWGGIIRHGAKTLYAYCEATVPKISLITRKTYGGAYEGTGGKETGTDWVFCWPSTELAVMGPDGAASIIFGKELKAAENPQELLQRKIQEYREQFANPYLAAGDLHVDDVIDPADTRPILIKALEVLSGKLEERPWKKHGVIPT